MKLSGKHAHPETGEVYTYVGRVFHETRNEEQQMVLHCQFEIRGSGVLLLERTNAFNVVEASQITGLVADWARALIEVTFVKFKPVDRCCTVEGTEVRDTGTVKGRGVFATRAFAAGELVETAYVVLDGIAPRDRIAFNYSAAMGLGSTRVHQHAIALGNGSLYNGANPANMRFVADVQAQAIQFIAARDIASGEELTVNYSAGDGGPTWPDNGWFEVKGLTML